MKTRYAIALAAVTGLSGAAAVHDLHAQTKPPIYYVAELDVRNEAALPEWGQKVEQAIRAAGGRYLVRGTDIVGMEGTPPKRIVIIAWDNMDQLKAWHEGPYKEMRALRDQAHRSVRAYAAQGVAN